jgi:hypothetical protein
MRVGALLVALTAAAGLSACGTAAPAPSGGTPFPSISGDAAGFATNCHPIELRGGPDLQRVDLTGAWTTVGRAHGFFFGANETTWILQVDDCVWGEIIDDDFLANPSGAGGLGTGGGGIGTLRGQLLDNFTVEGELITVAESPGAPGPLAEIKLVIEWDDGRIRLREDRDPRVQGPRCSFHGGGSVVCADPVILYRVDDDPLAELRADRDAICRPLYDQDLSLVRLLDADPPPEPSAKAELLDQIAVVVQVAHERLSALNPPESIAADFAVDVKRREAELAELVAEAKALRGGDLAEAERLEAAINPMFEVMREFEAAHRFSNCP